MVAGDQEGIDLEAMLLHLLPAHEKSLQCRPDMLFVFYNALTVQ